MTDLPEALRTKYASGTWTLAWENELGGTTHRVEGVGPTVFVKLAALGPGPSLAAEAARMRWAAPHLNVPKVIECGSDGARAWLVTEALPGVDATRCVGDARGTVEALGRGLARFHRAPVDSCPFVFRVEDALTLAERRVDAGQVDPARDFHPEHAHLSARTALGALAAMRPPSEDLVVCHGDYCFPNALLERGEVTGYVDLGELGVADRWWDLAVATWSATWNVGPGHEEALLAAYGVTLDRERQAFYRLLYDLVS